MRQDIESCRWAKEKTQGLCGPALMRRREVLSDLSSYPSNNQVCHLVALNVAYNGNGRLSYRQLRHMLAGVIPEAQRVTWLQDRCLWLLLPDTDLTAARTAAERVVNILKGVELSAIYTPTKPASTAGSAQHRWEWVSVWPQQSNLNRTHSSLSPITSSQAMPIWKRVMDVVGALLGLAIALPALLISAIIIKCVSKGPVFFRHQRIGFGGKPFVMLKLRTYHVHTSQNEDHKEHICRLISNGHHANGAPMRKLDDHAGIIPFGRLIRKTCIDELPQLINVLKGQMSLVGPRPALPYEVEMYSPWHLERFSAVPGMTGLWQVSGKNDLTFNQMVCLDIQYARSLSFWLDLKILLKTPRAIFRQVKGAFTTGPGQDPACIQKTPIPAT